MPIDPHRYESEAPGDTVTMHLADDAGDVPRFSAVTLVGDMTVAPTDAADDDIVGFTRLEGSAGDDVGVATHGRKRARVEAADGDVGAGMVLTAGSTSGVMNPLNDGDATGQSAQAGASLMTLTGADADGIATVLVR